VQLSGDANNRLGKLGMTDLAKKTRRNCQFGSNSKRPSGATVTGDTNAPLLVVNFTSSNVIDGAYT
jgi:hypothetical protein